MWVDLGKGEIEGEIVNGKLIRFKRVMGATMLFAYVKNIYIFEHPPVHFRLSPPSIPRHQIPGVFFVASQEILEICDISTNLVYFGVR